MAVNRIRYDRFVQVFETCLNEASFPARSFKATQRFFNQISDPTRAAEIELDVLARVNASIDRVIAVPVLPGDDVAVEFHWQLVFGQWATQGDTRDVLTVELHSHYQGRWHHTYVSGLLNAVGQITAIIDLPADQLPLVPFHH
jgi:hypothetical protein